MILRSLLKQYLLIVMSALALAGCGKLDAPWGPLLFDVQVTPDSISPNADGDQDVTEIRYSLRRAALVSIYFANEAGERFYFRESERRAAGNYSVYWGGAVDDPTVVETDYGTQEILSRVLDDGVYQWAVEAVDDAGVNMAATGPITLHDGDTEMPQLNNFVVEPTTFTPNQDSIDDRVSVNFYLTKNVNTMQVYLIDPAKPDVRFFLPPKPDLVEPNEAGYKDYDYDGGVDLNADPPPDGTYTIVAEARDYAGNAVRVSQNLTIAEGGKPRADVAQGEINWYAVWADGERRDETNRVMGLPLGDKLCFDAIVKNESTVPIRTAGPWPGQEYRFAENYNTIALAQSDESFHQQAGAWRFGINFDTTGVDFPYRWAIGRQDELEMRLIDGKEQWYLMPGKSGKTSGCIILDEKPPVGTTFWWGGLIQEFVAVVNNNIDRITVQVDAP
ncbi:MAG: hypothetical protein R2911_08760 [Caldilineaceae bacterium]